MADKKEEKKETKDKAKKVEKVKKTAKKAVEEVKEEVAEVVEEVKEEIEETKEKTKEFNSKTLVNIVAIALIAIALILGLVLVTVKPTPKRAAKDYLTLSVKNPIEALLKYGVSDFQEELARAKGKYVTFKIDSVGDIKKEGNREVVEVTYTEKGPNDYKIRQEAEENLEKRDITRESKNFNSEFIKEFKKLLREKSDQLEENKSTVTFYRNTGERNWKIDMGLE